MHVLHQTGGEESVIDGYVISPFVGRAQLKASFSITSSLIDLQPQLHPSFQSTFKRLPDHYAAVRCLVLSLEIRSPIYHPIINRLHVEKAVYVLFISTWRRRFTVLDKLA